MENRAVIPPVGGQVEWLARVDSTNDELKRRAAAGAPHGLVLAAREQTGGRGRMGRSFESPEGRGLYCSVLLRPACAPGALTDLTAYLAVAVCRAIEGLTGLSPEIKWTNDVLLGGKKICGILTEMQTAGAGLDWAIAGVGINLTRGEFSPEVAAVAGALEEYTDRPPTAEDLLAALIGELNALAAGFPGEKARWLEEYRRRCVTPGREVEVRRGGQSRRGRALEIDGEFRLVVEWETGERTALDGGEVSVRGLY